MKGICTLYTLRIAAVLTLILPSLIARAQFTNGNVVVLQVGLGTSALSGAATSVILKEYNKSTANQTSPVKTVYIDTTGPSRLTLSGSAFSEGQMTLSSDSTRLVLAGYDAAIGTATVASTSSASVPRTIDTLSNNAIPGRADSTHSAFSGANMRGVARTGSEDYWTVGSTTGLYYMGNLATPDVIYNATTSLRAVQALNGKLYFSTASGLSRIGRINSQPTAGPVTADTMIILGTGTTPSPNGFVVNSAENIVYVADDRSTTSGGGIQKWTRTGSVWSLAYTFGGAATRSVIADWSGTYPVLYAITSSGTGTLIKITDSNATAPAVTLATAPVNTAFRSVAFAPRPCVVPALSFSTTPLTCTTNGSVVLTTTGGIGPFTYAYTGPGSFTASTKNISNLSRGTYSVTVTATGGCTVTGITTVAGPTTPPPTAPLSPSGTITFCRSQGVVLRTNSAPGLTYTWKQNGTVLTGPGTSDSILTMKQSGIYKVIVNAGANCFDSSASDTLISSPRLNAITKLTGDTVCAGDTVRLMSPSDTGNVYHWLFATQSTLVPSDSSFKFFTVPTQADTVISVYSVITSSRGCVDTSAPAVITVSSLPAPPIVNNAFVLSTASYAGYQWKLNGLSIPGATGQLYSVTQNGDYSVSVTNSSGCRGQSAVVTITNVGVTNLLAQGIRLYPNPVKNMLHIYASINVTVEIKDAQGRQLSIIKNATAISLDDLPTGVFTASIYNDSGALLGRQMIVKVPE